MTENFTAGAEKSTAVLERSTSMQTGAATPAQLMEMIAGPQIAGPGRGQFKAQVNAVARRVSAALGLQHYPPIKPSRVEDIWRGEVEPRWWEMDAIRRAAADRQALKETRSEYAALTARIARLEAALSVQDEEFHRPGVDALRAVAGGDRRALAGGGDA